MKKRFISILLSLSLVTVPCAALTVSAAGSDTVTKKAVPAYLYGMDKQTEIECVFTQELPELVYIPPEDYLNHIYTTTNVQTKNADGTYSVTSENGTMVVDPNADTIYYEYFERFTIYSVNMEGTSTSDDYLKSLPPEQRGDIAPVTLNLADYGIDVIEYEGKVYMPLPTLNDIMRSPIISPCMLMETSISHTAWNIQAASATMTEDLC